MLTRKGIYCTVLVGTETNRNNRLVEKYRDFHLHLETSTLAAYEEPTRNQYRIELHINEVKTYGEVTLLEQRPKLTN